MLLHAASTRGGAGGVALRRPSAVASPRLAAHSPLAYRRRHSIAPRATAAPTYAAAAQTAQASLLLPPLRDASAVYVRGADLSEPSNDNQPIPSSLVVLGDVPLGAVARAKGDVVVVGALRGTASSDSPDAVVFALSLDPATASVTIAGEQADLSVPVAKLTALVVSRDAAAKGALAVRQLPSASATTPTTPTPTPVSITQALSLAKQLAPVALGLAVVAAPATALSALASVGGADGLIGSLVEAILFGSIILQGAKLLSEGSELLLEVLDPGVVGGVLLPVLGATPDALIILSSGLNGSPSEAAQQLSVGVGTLAGSNALLLSPAWAAAVFSGRCDLDPKTGEAIDRRLTVPLFGGGGGGDNANAANENNESKSPWTATGVTVDPDVKQGALIMALSVLLYGSVQIPSAFFNDPSDPKLAAAGAAACFLAGAAYCAYSVLSPELQRRRIAEARKRRLRALAAETLASRWLRGAGGDAPTTTSSTSTSRGPLLDSQGKVRRAVADAMFDEFDSDGSGHIDAAELRALLLGLQLGGGGANGDDGNNNSADSPQTREAIEFFWREMDVDGSSAVCRDEFAAALQSWVDEKLRTQAQAQAQAAATSSSNSGSSSSSGLKPPRAARADAWRSLLDPRQGGANAALLARLPEDDLEQLRRDAEALATEEAEDEEDDEEEGGHGAGAGGGTTTELSRSAIVAKSAAFLAGGLGLCAVFSDPLVEALSHLAEDLNVNPFFIAFALTPLASNASEVLSSLSFVGRKRRRNASLAFANLYGSATINNTLVLGILLTVISTRGIPWVYSSETAAIAFVSVSAAAVAATRTTLPLWTAVPIAAVWPLTLAGVYYLDTVLGWT